MRNLILRSHYVKLFQGYHTLLLILEGDMYPNIILTLKFSLLLVGDFEYVISFSLFNK